MRYAVAGLLLALVTALPVRASAADAKGQFGLRGAGLIPCSLYAREEGARGDVYKIVASWVDGYITGSNQHADDTYDLLSFETTELILEILAGHCHEHPDDPVFGVINSLFEKLKRQRLTQKSEKIDVKKGGFQTRLYVEVVKRVQARLGETGFYHGGIDGSFNDETSRAFAAYQESVGLKPTGFPDQTTLWRLLRSE